MPRTAPSSHLASGIPHSASAPYTLLPGDSLRLLESLDPASIHSICTDPPYGIGFMGSEWDSFKATRRGHNSVLKGGGQAAMAWQPGAYYAWCLAWARACLRVLKPGGHMLVFGGPRTFHRLACAIEDAGFEIRDCLSWLYGQGFPKSLDVSKAIDKALGAKRRKARHPQSVGIARLAPDGGGTAFNGQSVVDGTPATSLAAAWDGWGTALKPAWEPILLCRKPLDCSASVPSSLSTVHCPPSTGTVAANVLLHSTGALNIDACRIQTVEECARGKYVVADTPAGFGIGKPMGGEWLLPRPLPRQPPPRRQPRGRSRFRPGGLPALSGQQSADIHPRRAPRRRGNDARACQDSPNAPRRGRLGLPLLLLCQGVERRTRGRPARPPPLRPLRLQIRHTAHRQAPAREKWIGRTLPKCAGRYG